MKMLLKTHIPFLAPWVGALMAASCSSSTSGPAARTDASVQTGGAGNTSGAATTGGSSGTGGQTGNGGSVGGSSTQGAGGVASSSGGAATGGSRATGGAGGQGTGLPDANPETGGTTETGGALRTGGATISTGGRTVAGGTTAAGGAATDGPSATGGTTASGGATAAVDGGTATTGWVTIHNDFFWYDTTGTLINVRSGALRKFGDLYYWYGGAPNDHNQTCYSSPDLVHWTYKGIVLTTTGDANRMDILYNATTKQYVIFLKYIGNGAYFGIATGSTPDGQFTFKSQTLVDGFVIGDMSVYQDDDGTAYLAYVWWGTGTNKAHGIYRLSADYLTLDTRMYLWNEGSREAPHMFKRNGVYYYGVSETNGIQPSPTRYYTATNLTGPWSAETMVTTTGSTTTYETQCDFVFPFTGPQGTVYMLDADRWIPTGGFQGDYLWLPFQFGTALVPTMTYYQDWDLNAAAGTWRAFDRTTRDLALGKKATASSESGTNVATNVTTATTYQTYTNYRWESAASDPQWIMVDLGAATEIDRVILKWYSDYGKSFKIQTSTDSTTWTDVYSTTTGASYSVTDVSFAKTTARYVRMSGTQRGNQNGYSLFAFMVLNDP
jgi:hypothetical protein